MEGKILVIKNAEKENPGTIEHFFANNGWDIVTIELQRGDKLPAGLEETSAIVILGGPMNVHEGHSFPFLKDEEKLIRKALIEDIPMLGICLGAQLIAKTCNAIVEKAPEKEIGWYRVKLTSEGQKDVLFQGLPKNMHVFQWHEDTFEVPSNGVLLVQSDKCKNQAFRIGNHVYGLQFHVEVTKNMIKEWTEDAPMNIDVQRVMKNTVKLQEEFEQHANQIFLNFKRLIESALRIKRIMKLFIDDEKKSRNKKLLWWDINEHVFSSKKYSAIAPSLS